ncbi:MAG: hypothetical protein ACI8Y3_001793 [Paraglaciecola sp.]|jgi:hypothetical protein
MHRSSHQLAVSVTDQFEQSRKTFNTLLVPRTTKKLSRLKGQSKALTFSPVVWLQVILKRVIVFLSQHWNITLILCPGSRSHKRLILNLW